MMEIKDTVIGEGTYTGVAPQIADAKMEVILTEYPDEWEGPKIEITVILKPNSAAGGLTIKKTRYEGFPVIQITTTPDQECVNVNAQSLKKTHREYVKEVALIEARDYYTKYLMNKETITV